MSDTVKLDIDCRSCHKTYVLEVTQESLGLYYVQGAYVQVAFPYLTAGERELLISGTCDACFNEMFPPED